MMNTKTEFPIGSWERPDAGGIVRRGEGASEHFKGYVERFGEAPRCHVGHHFDCERESVMDVYGLHFCEAHGEQAAASAFEEIYHDLESRWDDSNRTYATNVDHALRLAMKTLPSYEDDYDRKLRAAFPYDEKARKQVLEDTLLYFQLPQEERFGFAPPYDQHRTDCVVVCRHMRIAFEQRETWLVELLEEHREASAVQAAWALAVEDEIEPR